MDNRSEDNIGNKCVLHRVGWDRHPDELGNPYDYTKAISEMIDNHGYKAAFKGLDIFLVHPDSDYLKKAQEQGKITLLDIDLEMDGNQGALGLYWHRDRLELKTTPKTKDLALKVLSHELGHHVVRYSGMLNDDLYIERAMRKLWEENKSPNPTSDGEKAAEEFKAFFGHGDTVGKFSNNISYTKDDNPKLYTLHKVAPWLKDNLQDEVISDLKFYGKNHIIWKQFVVVLHRFWLFQYSTLKFQGWFRVGHDFQMEKYVSGKWIEQ